MIAIDHAFAHEFEGMTVEHIPLETLLATRERLVRDLQSRLAGAPADFLVSIHDATPKFELIGLPQAAALPAVRWKLLNLERLKTRDPEKHAAQREALERVLARGSS